MSMSTCAISRWRCRVVFRGSQASSRIGQTGLLRSQRLPSPSRSTKACNAFTCFSVNSSAPRNCSTSASAPPSCDRVPLSSSFLSRIYYNYQNDRDFAPCPAGGSHLPLCRPQLPRLHRGIAFSPPCLCSLNPRFSSQLIPSKGPRLPPLRPLSLSLSGLSLCLRGDRSLLQNG